ncbi:MAG TPA: patatin-like phospholipase family protein [Solirubrobacteraceae bacterium]|jgi:NTE family protein|nr:patatin-like phospholipase family protein [Solirubrobacteraceae bacterium]
MNEPFADLVFEGGGVKGIGLAGAYSALCERGVGPKRVAGTSAGAITAALVAAGYSAEELDEILLEVPFARFKDTAWEDRIPIVGHPLSVLLQRGIYEGGFFREWMRGLLAAKGVRTFGQLADPEATELKERYRLKVIVSDVTHRRLLVLPDDAASLGIEPDDLEVAYAVRMSMSIPIFFEPVMHRNPRTGVDHLIVDGGMLSNFPVWLFDADKGEPPRWPTFGMLLVEGDPKVPVAHRVEGRQSGSIIDYIKALASTMMEAHDRLYLEKATFVRTIPIPTLGVSTTEFDITPARVRAIYESGRRAAFDFLDRWDFEAYKAEYRAGKDHSRREELATRPAEPLSAPPSGGLAPA